MDLQRIIRPMDGEILGPPDGVRDRFLIDSRHTDGRLAVVEHLLAPRAIAAPIHRHHREDEFSFVVSGRIGAYFDGEEVFAGPGELIVKPREEWHTFWNAGTEPARLVEIITPGGLEELFRTLDGGVSDEEMAALATRFDCDVDEEATLPLVKKYDLTFGW